MFLTLIVDYIKAGAPDAHLNVRHIFAVNCETFPATDVQAFGDLMRWKRRSIHYAPGQ